MAKKAASVNKSAAIRDYYDANPSAKPKEVVGAMKAKGVIVTPAFVSTIRANSKKKASVRKPGRPSKSKTAVRAGRPPGRRAAASNDDVSVATLLRVKKTVEEIGSVAEVRSALDTLQKLLG